MYLIILFAPMSNDVFPLLRWNEPTLFRQLGNQHLGESNVRFSKQQIVVSTSQLVSTFQVLGICQVVGACQVYATNLVVSTQVSPNRGKVGWGSWRARSWSPPAKRSPRGRWCRRWCRRRPPSPSARWSSRTSKQYSTCGQYSESGKFVTSENPSSYISNKIERAHWIGHDRAKSAADVGKGKKNRLLWSRHPSVSKALSRKQIDLLYSTPITQLGKKKTWQIISWNHRHWHHLTISLGHQGVESREGRSFQTALTMRWRSWEIYMEQRNWWKLIVFSMFIR